MLHSHLRLGLPIGHFLRGVIPQIIVQFMKKDPIFYLTVVQEGNLSTIMKEINPSLRRRSVSVFL